VCIRLVWKSRWRKQKDIREEMVIDSLRELGKSTGVDIHKFLRLRKAHLIPDNVSISPKILGYLLRLMSTQGKIKFVGIVRDSSGHMTRKVYSLN